MRLRQCRSGRARCGWGAPCRRRAQQIRASSGRGPAGGLHRPSRHRAQPSTREPAARAHAGSRTRESHQLLKTSDPAGRESFDCCGHRLPLPPVGQESGPGPFWPLRNCTLRGARRATAALRGRQSRPRARHRPCGRRSSRLQRRRGISPLWHPEGRTPPPQLSAPRRRLRRRRRLIRPASQAG